MGMDVPIKTIRNVFRVLCIAGFSRAVSAIVEAVFDNRPFGILEMEHTIRSLVRIYLTVLGPRK